ncbi:MAG: hypothetical protein JXK08_09710 [Flavobacteriaceae bacterium]|nr:hypothetical protein [Paludibacteraceae bacterium]MBN2868936.1 hypothetical protein [Flavobacteriaceae bacterium]
MKKLFLLVTLVAASFTANAATTPVIYDFTGTVTGSAGSVVSGYTVLLCNGLSTYSVSADLTFTGMTGLEVWSKNTDATKEGIRWNYDSREAGQYGLVGNGGDDVIGLQNLLAGDIIYIKYERKGSSAVDFDNTAKSTPAGAAAYNVTADAGNVASSVKGEIVVEKYTVNANGEAYLYFTNADILQLSVNSVLTASVNDAIASELLKKVANELVNPTNLEVEVYSVAGVKVLSSSAASISVSGLANGAYIAKTAEGTLKFVK